MFRRTKSAEATSPGSNGTAAAAGAVKEGGKGRPTPTRKEAEAAAKARAKAVQSGKAATKQERAALNAKAREGMRKGDERYLPTRDKGPVRRFIRDYVDGRLCMAEFLVPVVLLMFVLSATDPVLANSISMTAFVLVIVDSLWMSYRLKRTLRAKFPDESHRGAVSYAIIRSMQIRWLRLPKPQVKLGGAPKA